MCYTFPNNAGEVGAVLFERTQEDRIALFFILFAIYVLNLLFMRMNLKDELRFITHKRVFRHRAKRNIPFFRRFFLLNYVEQFKKQWYWHYIVFLLTVGSGLLALLLHAAVIFFPGSYALAQAHFAMFLLCALSSCMQIFFPDTRRWRRRKKDG